jgi:hypothetical protein
MQFLKQSTASQTRILGPFVDDTDGKTAETALTINASDVKLMANGAASANKNSGGGTHRVNGMYSLTFNATDTATVGELAVSVVVAGALPVFTKFYVLEEAVFDALFGASAAGPITTLGTNAPASWINAAAIASDAITAAKIASGAITNAKFASGAIDATAIASDAITAAKIATGAITNAKLAAGAISSTTFATAAITADACAADFIGAAEIAASASQEIADLIAADWVAGDGSPLAIAAAVKAALIHADDLANKIRVNANGVVHADLREIEGTNEFVYQLNASLETGLLAWNQEDLRASVWTYETRTLTTAPPTAEQISAQIANDINGEINDWDSALPVIASYVSGEVNAPSAETISEYISNSIVADGEYWAGAKAAVADAVWDEARAGHTTAGTFGFYLDAAISSVSGGGGGGGDDAATIYSYFTDGTRANAFKADVSALSTFDATTDEVIVATNNDKTGYALTSGERDTLAGVIDSRLLDDGDATDLIASIVTRIGNTNIDQAAFVAAVKAALFDAGSASNKLAVDSSGRVTIGTNADKTGYSLTTAPLDASGIRSAIGLASANLDTQLSSIEATVDTEALASDLAPLLAGTTISIESPIFSGDEGQDLSLIQGDDYASRPVRINIESEEDLTGLHFVIAARLQSNTATKLGLRMQIQSDDDGQFALFAPTAEQTEAWAAGTYELRHRIQYDTNKFKTLKNGILTISPFDTPTPLINVDPT